MLSLFEDIIKQISRTSEENPQTMQDNINLVEDIWGNIVDIAGFSIKLNNPLYVMLREMCPKEANEEIEALRTQINSRIRAISIMRPKFNALCRCYGHQELEFDEEMTDDMIYKKAMKLAEAGFDEQSEMLEAIKQNT